MKRKLLLALCMISIIIFVFSAISASALTSGIYTYTVSDGEATITEVYTSISGDVKIPSTLGGYPVTSIGHFAFSGCSNLTNITIPNSVISIDYNAFYNCNSLTIIAIPDSVASIGSEAFYGTAYYNNSLNWENDVLYIGNHLIKAKETIAGEYNIKPGTVAIADSAFRDCSSLTSITIPDGITSIGSEAFYNCSSLTNINIPDSVTSIGDYAFYDTAYYNNYSNWGKNRVLYIGNHLIKAKEGIKGKYNVKPGTVTIADCAFEYCGNLTSITIPDSVTSIGDYAFSGCSNLTSITIPDGVTGIGYKAFYWCDSLTSITIPDSVTSIGDNAFCGCNNLTTVAYNGNNEDWNKIDIDINNEELMNADIEYFYYVTLLDNLGNEISKTRQKPDSIVDVSGFIIPEGYEIILYIDDEFVERFDENTAIVENVFLYAEFVKADGEVFEGTKTEIYDDGKSFIVHPINVITEKTIILALYDGEQFVEMQSAVYDGRPIPFTTTETYTNAKVMIWNNLTDFKPNCDAETIEYFTQKHCNGGAFVILNISNKIHIH